MSSGDQARCPIEEQYPEYTIVNEFNDLMRQQYPEHVCGCGIMTIGWCDASAPESEKDKRCIRMLLKKPLPPGVSLPNEYKGLKVFPRVIGPVRLGR